MADDIEDLKNRAAPVSVRLVEALERLAYSQDTTNKLLEAKNAFDIKTHKQSTKINLFGTFIACCALYIAVVGFDGNLPMHLYNIFK